jgi:hypothetical protein
VGDDRGKIVEARLPAERRASLPAVGNDPRRIAGAARRDCPQRPCGSAPATLK